MTSTRTFDPSRISVVTTCMNRNGFLAKAMPTWLDIGFSRIVVVDWNSAEPVSEHLDTHVDGVARYPVFVVRSERHARSRYFNDGWARNTGSRLCDTEFIFFIDSDIIIREPRLLFQEVSNDPGICYRGNIPGGYGTCLVDRRRFEAVNGYSERMWSWGGEDLDLYIRLKVEQGCEIETFFPDDLLEHIEHGDAERVRHRFQEWDDLKRGADIQRLERPPWTVSDGQQQVEVTVFDKKQGTSCERML